ncbi:10289_t:CDS:2 [Funneliformis geosporum]|uniref:10289_t:CDS:1 n=1 Tax=Funneliformis geosporum TaxID=1117311 RepID=A0A9W4WX44_9GLOM|nr:10289_t:CDS:2 [Funneliformis geosporum]
MKTARKSFNNRQIFAFPPKEELERVIKYFSDPNCKEINQGLMPNASELDKVKYNVCQSISRYKRINNLTPAELAQKIGISQVKTDDILFGRISELSFEELASYTEKLSGHLQLKVNYDRKTKRNTEYLRGCKKRGIKPDKNRLFNNQVIRDMVQQLHEKELESRGVHSQWKA